MWTRRAFMRNGGIALFTVGLTGAGPTFLSRAASAAPQTGDRRKVLVTIFQRGAMDGIAAVSPLDQQHWLKKLRPRLTRRRPDGPAPSLRDLGDGFGLHPSFEALLPLWKTRNLAVVHAVGSPDPTRSHFEAQDYMESGTPGEKSTRSGWLNRVCGELGHEASPLRAMSLTPSLPRSLYGEASALAVDQISDLQLGSAALPQPTAETLSAGLESLYRQTSQQLLRGTAKESLEAVERIERLRQEGYAATSGIRYPKSPLGDSLQQIAQLVKAEVGLEIAFAESGGWDTHVHQGYTRGSFALRANDLAVSIAAFWQDLGRYRDDVAVMTMTEFGRTVAENDSGGTDHGHGSCLFVLGADVAGGKVHGQLESLDPDALYESRDLPVHTDFRAVFSEVAHRHLGVPANASIFPGYSGGRLPLWRSV